MAYASTACWLVICVMYTTSLGVAFDLPTTVKWSLTLLATLVWQAFVQQPLLVTIAVFSAPLLEKIRSAYYHLMQYVPFQI
jgi:hypothetical protein